MNYTLVGGFVLLLGAALIAGVLWLASGGAWAKRQDLYLSVMEESVAGLNLNAPVKYMGVNVGKVQAISLAPANPKRVRLLFAIDRGTPVRRDTVAVLKTHGLTGIAYVELDGGAAASPALQAVPPERYPQIRSKPSLSARLEEMLSTVLGKLDSSSTQLNALLSPQNQRAFSATLGDIALLSHTLAERRQTIDAGLRSAAQTFDNSAAVSEQLRRQAGPLIARMDRAAQALEQMGIDTAQASSSAGRTVSEVGSDVKRFTATALPDLQQLMGELAVLAVSLRRLSEQLERNPSGLVFGQGLAPNGPGERQEQQEQQQAPPAEKTHRLRETP
ncbi:MlaD family protein [Paucibacter sp. Y2R2-4]|uniref:MlaD family protein n=1 Tax=Paucibacter sp. Y2R2-4 TaxID=2893553 RepID=UPI0021E4E388|nr:MlaD family protein [Paucibacter sp. Y2R2-4]MCV2352265.1 MCE family protein [Paucibacter sp. Y2R2-4]